MLFKVVLKQLNKFVNIKTFKQYHLLVVIWLVNIFIRLQQNMEKELNVIWELKITVLLYHDSYLA